MARFVYQYKNNTGKLQTGSVDAISEQDARAKIKNQNRIPLNLKSNLTAVNPGAKYQARIPHRSLVIFTRQFSILINSGIALTDSLRILSDSYKRSALGRAINSLRGQIENGRRLAEAMSTQPHVFSKLFIAMTRAGEEAGILDIILERMALYLEKTEKLRRQVLGALTYPAIVLLLGISIIWAILVYVFPMFQSLYGQGGKDLPTLTLWVLNISKFLSSNALSFLISVGGIVFLTTAWLKTSEGRDTIDALLIDSPGFGEVIKKAAVARLARTLSTLLSSGISILDAIDIAARTSGNSVIEKALLRSKESVSLGKTLASSLTKEKVFPDMVVQMIAIGEHSGSLDKVLTKIADFYEDDVENAIKFFTTLIEPILLIFIGGIVAFLLIAMYLPIFSLSKMSGL